MSALKCVMKTLGDKKGLDHGLNDRKVFLSGTENRGTLMTFDEIQCLPCEASIRCRCDCFTYIFPSLFCPNQQIPDPI